MECGFVDFIIPIHDTERIFWQEVSKGSTVYVAGLLHYFHEFGIAFMTAKGYVATTLYDFGNTFFDKETLDSDNISTVNTTSWKQYLIQWGNGFKVMK